MSRQAVLLFEERQLLSKQDGPLMWNIQSGEGMLRRGSVERVLGPVGGVTACTGAEDFTHVIQGLGPGKSAPDGQLLEQVIGAKLRLQTIIAGISAIVAGAGDAQVAELAANRNLNNCIGCWASRYSRRD